MTANPPIAAETPWENLFGICACLGQDLGFNPLYLRIALGAGLLWNPVIVIAAYLGTGIVVLATRLLFPDAKPVPAAPVEQGVPSVSAYDPPLAQAA